MTNYEKIAGTPEKLAALLDEFCEDRYCGECPFRFDVCYDPKQSEKTWLQWLESEATENGL